MTEKRGPHEMYPLRERVPTLQKDGFVQISSDLTEEEKIRVGSRLYEIGNYGQILLITGKVRQSLLDNKAKWLEESYLFDTAKIEPVLIPKTAETDEEIVDEQKKHIILLYMRGYPILHTPQGTILLRPVVEEDLQCA